MYVECVDLAAVADEVGTPFYCYSAAAVSEAYRAWRQAFEAAGFPSERHRTCYAVKANSALSVIRHLAEAGASFDVVSAGELHRVAAAGAPVDGAVFSGPGKSLGDLQAAVGAKVGLINVEGPGEIETLQQLASEAGRPIDVGLRLNPDLDPHTHPAIATGPRQTKFGLAPSEIEELQAAGVFGDGLLVKAVSVHIGSQITDLDALEAAAREARQWAERLCAAGHPVAWIDIGGGLAIPYDDDATVPSPAQLAERVGAALAEWPGGLITEPGRVIVGPAGWLVTRVTSVRGREARGLLVCDAGMNALLRPALYGATHRVTPVVESSGDPGVWDVVGPLCETGDVLAREVSLSGVGVGTLLAVRDTGAYGFVMASEYNAHPRPAQIWISGDRWAVITPRATYEEMTRGESLAPWQAAGAAEPSRQ